MSAPDEESLSEDEAMSTDSYTIVEIKRWGLEDGRLCYVCVLDDGSEETIDRSDLMDGGSQQKMVLQIERRDPPPWDPDCPSCDGEGCEECECPDCERPCRFLQGINYGCPRHPVI